MILFLFSFKAFCPIPLNWHIESFPDGMPIHSNVVTTEAAATQNFRKRSKNRGILPKHYSPVSIYHRIM